MVELVNRAEQIRLRTQDDEWTATLWLPEMPDGMVVLARESGLQRVPPAGDYQPTVLRDARLGIVCFDAGRATQPDATRTACDRLRAACAWVASQAPLAELPLGLVGAGAGAAAALEVAAELGKKVRALVARAPRGELRQWPRLMRISAPTLLIAGSLDEQAVETSRQAYALLRCKKRFEIVPGATQAFDEPGSFEVAARLARNWVLQHVFQRA